MQNIQNSYTNSVTLVIYMLNFGTENKILQNIDEILYILTHISKLNKQNQDIIQLES